MRERHSLAAPGRREFLHLLGAGALSVAMPVGGLFAQKPGAKPLRGIFPITQTPFTTDNKLDVNSLVEELRFLDRGRVHGFVWPQMVSEWLTLSEQERLQGMEAVASAGKKLKPAIVFGVQARDVPSAVKFAKHAQAVGADAIISLPPSENLTSQQMLDYYKTIAAAAPQLPLFVQAVGNMDVNLVMAMFKAIPTMRYLKDEAGDVLDRIVQIPKLSGGQIKVFTGAHGRTLIEEMRRGCSGCMPVAGFADLYAATWDLWQAGKQKEAMEMHARTLLLLTEMGIYGTDAMKYILYLRGVFKTYNVRKMPTEGFAAATKAATAGSGVVRVLDDAGKQALKQTVDILKPYFRA
jgi:4-hydroxy-tetrahydrodipicolinate synthase